MIDDLFLLFVFLFCCLTMIDFISDSYLLLYLFPEIKRWYIILIILLIIIVIFRIISS